MKNFLVFLCALSTPLLFAQNWQWGVRGGGDSSFTLSNINFPYEQVRSIEVDNQGNIYALSPIAPTNADIDGVPKETYSGFNFVGEAQADYAISSFSCSGEYRWSKIIGGYSHDELQRLGVDNEGSVYAAGKVKNPGALGSEWDDTPVHFDTDTILPVSSPNVNENKRGLFMVKYNSEGTLQWLAMPQPENVSSADDTGKYASVDLSVDSQGNSFWLCILPSGPVANGGYVVPESDALYSYHMLKYDKEGNFLGGFPVNMSFEGGAGLQIKMVRNPANGIFYIVGYLYGDEQAAVFGGQAVEHFFYIAAYDGQGNFLWKKENTSDLQQGCGINDITLDAQGNIYVTGGTTNGDSYEGYQFVSQTPYILPFVMKLNPQGEVIWGSNAYSSSAMFGRGVAVSADEVAITGLYRRAYWGNLTIEIPINTGVDAYIARFNRETGDIIAIDGITSSIGYRDEGTAITADTNGNFYVGGQFENQLTINGENLINDGSQTDFFIAKYGDANCNCQAPVASFSIEQFSDAYNYTFTYTGSAGYESVLWDFGDGSTSTQESPSHQYNQPGSYQVCLTVVSTDCGSAEYCSTLAPALSTDDFESPGLQAYPNPASDVLHVELLENAQFSLVNILGTTVSGGTLTAGNNTIDISALQQGVYMFKVTTGTKTYNEKILISK